VNSRRELCLNKGENMHLEHQGPIITHTLKELIEDKSTPTENRMTKKNIKQAFKNHGVQLNSEAQDQIIYELQCVVNRMAKRCQEGNVKRLTPELFYIAMGKLND
jgi:hypothetical protein